MGRRAVGRSEPDRRDRRARGPQGQDRRQHPGLSGESVQPARHGPAVRDLRDAAGARRREPAEVRLRQHDSRALPAPRPLRRRPLRAEVRRRGAPARLLPLQARLQGTGDARQLLRAALRRSRSTRGRSASAIPCFGCTEQKIAFRVPLHTTVDIDRPTPPDTYPPIHATQGGVSPVATGVAGAILGGLAGAGYVASKKLTPVAERRTPRPRRRYDVGITRRAALCGLLTAGATAAGVDARHRQRSCRSRRPTPSACSTTPRSASAARRASSPARTRTACRAIRPASTRATTRPVDLSYRAKNVIKLYHDGDTRSFVKVQCMHCIDPACVAACMLGALKKREFGIVTLRRQLLRRLPLLRGGVPVRRPEVPVGVGRAEDRQVRAVQSPPRERAGARLHRGLSAPRRDLRQARRSAQGSKTADCREPGTLRAEDLRRDRRRRHAGAVPVAPAVRQARVPGARRRAGAHARAVGPARRLQGLRRAARALRGARHDRVPQPVARSRRAATRRRGTSHDHRTRRPIGGPLFTRGTRLFAGLFGARRSSRSPGGCSPASVPPRR